MPQRGCTCGDAVAQSKGVRIPTRKWVIRGRAPVPRVMRWWRLGPWSRNRLMRSGDRAEAVMTVVAVLLLVLLQFAAAFGMVTYTGLERQAAIARATVHPVPAVLLEDPIPPRRSPRRSVPPEPSTGLGPGGRRRAVSAPERSRSTRPREWGRRSPSRSTPRAI